MERPAQLEAHQRNVKFGLFLFGVFLLLLVGTVVVAFLYLHFD